MWIWFLSLTLFYFGLKISLNGQFTNIQNFLFSWQKKRQLRRAFDVFQELQDTIESGLMPLPDRWDQLRQLSVPWGPLSDLSLNQLRSSGASIIPTLRRLKSLVQNQFDLMDQAQSKVSQASVQAFVCIGLVPVLWFSLLYLLPGNDRVYTYWILALLLALFIGLLGSVWIIHQAESARWGGLNPAKRNWILTTQCASERVLALIQSGEPIDSAWSKAYELILEFSPDFHNIWGSSLWKKDEGNSNQKFVSKNSLEGILNDFVMRLRGCLQTSSLEGFSCTEKIEQELETFRSNVFHNIDKELNLLPTRALKPLFICVAPSLFGLLAFGIFQALQNNF